MIRVFIALALCASAQGQDQIAGGGQIKGAIADVLGVAVSGSLVRVFESPLNKPVTSVISNEDGSFHVGMLRPGFYKLIARSQGFRAVRLTVPVRDNETADLGKIRLEFAGCDAPGTHCLMVVVDEADYTPDPILKRGHLTLGLNCDGDLQTGKSYCSDAQSKITDLRIARDEIGIYLTAINGAAVSSSTGQPGDCRKAAGNGLKLRIDDFGPGDDICVNTRDGHPSHVFFLEEVEPATQSIPLWYTTRPR